MPTKIIRILGFALLIAALEAQALTLGRLRGAAIIGQGLDVSVQVQTDADESLSNLCLEAEVFHADTRQDSPRVRVSFDPVPPGQASVVRIRSSVAVDEPVVTVYLSAGCSQKITRRYVMLADVVSEQAPPVAAPALQVPLVNPAPTPGSAQAASASPPAAPPASSGVPAGSRAGPAAGFAAAAPAAPTRRAEPPLRSRPAPAKAVAPAPAAKAAERLSAGRVAGQSRLKLDPLEVLSDRVATLESSTASAPAAQAARDSREAERLQTLENSVKNLLAVATRNEASMADLRTRLQQAEADRYWNPLVYALAALLLVSLAGVGYLLGRQNSGWRGAGGNWWNGNADAEDDDPVRGSPVTVVGRSGFSPMSAPAPLSGPDSLPGADQTPQQVQRAVPPANAAPITQVDVSLMEMSESTFDRLMQSGASHSAVRKSRQAETAAPPAGAVAGASRRLINAEELFDIRQQAEFFVSLGQTDQAVRILENRISESGESSPLAYLDLMKIFHSLGLKADFRQVSEDFNVLFNVRVPEFAGFDKEGRDLEDYPDVLATVTAVWGKPEIFANIEALLFRDQWNTQREPVDLAAFRDLLLLHAVAHTASGLPDEMHAATHRSMPRSPFSEAPKFMPQALAPTSATEPLPELDVAGVVDVDVDLDIDLSLPEPGLTSANADGAPHAAVEPGNLMDFDLPKLPDHLGDPKTGA